MRVAIITANFPGVAGTFVIELIAGLIDLGVEVDIFSFGIVVNPGQMHPKLIDYKMMERVYPMARMPDRKSLAILQSGWLQPQRSGIEGRCHRWTRKRSIRCSLPLPSPPGADSGLSSLERTPRCNLWPYCASVID